MTVDDFSFALHGFSGKARLLPLPNAVLFPHVMQPLRIFEPRYRDLLAAAMDDDRLIAMVLLQPGWEPNYEGRPPIHSVGCLGQITAHHQLDDGSSNVLVSGIKRICVVREFPAECRYREAEVEVLEDYCPSVEEEVGLAILGRLRNAFTAVLPRIAESREQIEQWIQSDLSLAVLTDVISYMLDIPVLHKLALLGETNVHRRAELLLEYLAITAADMSPGAAGVASFPPGFSAN
jgi:Lon protease-like protein